MRKPKKDFTKKLTNWAMLGVLLINTFVAPMNAISETVNYDHYKTEESSN